MIADLVPIVKEAGVYAMEQQDSVAHEAKPSSDGDDEYQEEKAAFTKIDAEVEHMLVDKIRELIPNITVIGEEHHAHENTVLEGKILIVDPIDGTLNYTRGSPNWGVSVAIAADTDIVVGVIYYPKLDIILTTEKGKGCFINGEKITLEQPAFSETDLIRVGGSWPDVHVARENFTKESAAPRSYVVTLLSLLGQLDHFPYVAYCGYDIPLYDFGCGPLAWEEAGGVILSLDGEPMNPLENIRTSDRGLLVNRKFVMAPSVAYAKAVISKL